MASAAYLRHYSHSVCDILVVCSRQPRGDLTRAVNIGSVESQLLYPSAVYCLRPNTLPDYSCRVGPGPQNAYSNNPFKSRKNSRSPECLALGTGTSSLTGPTDVTCREIPSAGHPPASTPPRPSCLRLPSAPPPAPRRLRPPLRLPSAGSVIRLPSAAAVLRRPSTGFDSAAAALRQPCLRTRPGHSTSLLRPASAA